MSTPLLRGICASLVAYAWSVLVEGVAPNEKWTHRIEKDLHPGGLGNSMLFICCSFNLRIPGRFGGNLDIDLSICLGDDYTSISGVDGRQVTDDEYGTIKLLVGYKGQVLRISSWFPPLSLFAYKLNFTLALPPQKIAMLNPTKNEIRFVQVHIRRTLKVLIVL
jgi:hypothetical protein